MQPGQCPFCDTAKNMGSSRERSQYETLPCSCHHARPHPPSHLHVPPDPPLRRRSARPPRPHPAHLSGSSGLLDPARVVTAADPPLQGAQATQPGGNFVARLSLVVGYEKTQVLASIFGDRQQRRNTVEEAIRRSYTTAPRTAGKLLVQGHPRGVLGTQPRATALRATRPLCPSRIWRERSIHEAQGHRS